MKDKYLYDRVDTDNDHNWDEEQRENKLEEFQMNRLKKSNQ
jgi:hypothetical protein